MNYFHQNVEYMSTSCSLKLGRCHLPTSYYDMHWHNGIEMIYGCSSRYTVTAGSTVYNMSDGDILFVPSRMLHSFVKNNQPDPLYFIIFKVDPMFTGGDVYRGKYDTQDFNPIIRSTVKISSSDHPELYPQLKHETERLIEIMLGYSEGFRYRSVSCLYEIIALLYQYKISGVTADESVTGEQMASVSKSFEFLEKHYGDEITISDAAECCGFNTKYFGRLFFRITGSYFNDFLTDFRINKASEMLRSGDMHIADIAYECGFSGSSTFYRAFRKKYGCSPKQFAYKYKN